MATFSTFLLQAIPLGKSRRWPRKNKTRNSTQRFHSTDFLPLPSVCSNIFPSRPSRRSVGQSVGRSVGRLLTQAQQKQRQRREGESVGRSAVVMVVAAETTPPPPSNTIEHHARRRVVCFFLKMVVLVLAAISAPLRAIKQVDSATL